MADTPILMLIIGFLVALTIHEAAHAWMSDRLGDPTAKLSGRLSLNPLAHIDIYGTVLVPLFLILLRFPLIFGWAKPVVFDPYNLKNPRRDAALISLAGPGANLALAIACSVILRIISDPFSPYSFLISLLTPIIALNVVLAIFNLIPIHPLDGGKIFIGLLPEKDAREADVFLTRYGMIILILLIFPIFGGASPVFVVLTPIISFLLKILIPGNPVI
jgi:Zn-dependent protease